MLGYHQHGADTAALRGMFGWMAARQTSWKTWNVSSATSSARCCKVSYFYQVTVTHMCKLQGATLRIINDKLTQQESTPLCFACVDKIQQAAQPQAFVQVVDMLLMVDCPIYLHCTDCHCQNLHPQHMRVVKTTERTDVSSKYSTVTLHGPNIQLRKLPPLICCAIWRLPSVKVYSYTCCNYCG